MWSIVETHRLRVAKFYLSYLMKVSVLRALPAQRSNSCLKLTSKENAKALLTLGLHTPSKGGGTNLWRGIRLSLGECSPTLWALNVQVLRSIPRYHLDINNLILCNCASHPTSLVIVTWPITALSREEREQRDLEQLPKVRRQSSETATSKDISRALQGEEQ